MEELIVSKEELIQLFESQVIEDTGRAWLMDGKVIEIIALHDIEPRFLQDVTNAKFYKLIIKGNK
ncbi:hypothetical protein AVENP_1545 [Arcobacter venerupis]|uniref:Uncharacterized protein n=1 Tax=Arcobacter venerupis TaxID=1054033 RepID=A0AAE7BB27_9BACT|nr:hypothetical protein [Arcobacter venerupis]QKF67097.1 hypothetical protein AVENP_1545 [Arcobacter venerupis]RWS49958.1 hypothetical protein CKA56_05635 [Arcobacter venerupis]